eukprot:GDKJ01010356.1.p1 GENE.GDKJ01010356.1~~GDKJ01010356.1.p1  ORF type:complete len:425 (-),score=142.95 GDKJ01010356.1:98-1372(-)
MSSGFRPLYKDYENDLTFKKKAEKIRNRKNFEEDVEEIIPEKISKKIMTIAKKQNVEDSDNDEDINDVDVDDQGFVNLDDAFGDEEELAMQMFLGAPQAGGIRTLADLISKRVEDSKSGVKSSILPAPVQATKKTKHTFSLAELLEQQQKEEEDKRQAEENALPGMVVLALQQLGLFLKRYKSGKLPKIAKTLPLMEMWEEAVHCTDPTNWSPHAMKEMTKYFASSLSARMSQRFYALVLLPNIRADIAENKKLNVHHYAALKKAMFKPDGWMKGILLPLAADECTVREAAIIASVLAKLSIPVAHAAAAMLKLAESKPWYATTSYFIGVLINKKYALPYSVLEGLVKHFHSFINETRTLPVVWHKALLFLAQRYKFEFNDFQRKRLFEVLRVHLHPGIGPEIRRELQSVNALIAVSSAGMELE